MKIRFTKKEKSYINNIIQNVGVSDNMDKEDIKIYEKICNKLMLW